MNFYSEHPNTSKSKWIAGSVLTSLDFLAWCRKNIYVDTHSREGVTYVMANINYYLFILTWSNQLSKCPKILSDQSNLINLTNSSHIPPLHSVTSSPFTTTPSSPVQVTLELWHCMTHHMFYYITLFLCMILICIYT